MIDTSFKHPRDQRRRAKPGAQPDPQETRECSTRSTA